MKLILNLILLIIFLIPSEASATGYDGLLSSHSFTYENTTTVENVRIYFHGRSSEDFDTVQSVSRKSVSLFSEFYGALDQCKDLELHVYELPRNILNDRDIMSFLTWSNWENINVFGTYDSISSRAGTASIFLTRDVGNRIFVDTISHEITHFWQDTHCIKIEEKGARDFERFYRSN